MLLVTEPLRGHLAMVVDRFAKAVGGRRLGFEAVDNNTYRAAVKSVFGQEALPDFDLERANYVLSFGADFLSTWLSPTRWSRGYGELRQGPGREQRGLLVHVDPRFSMTAANADQWVPVRPGMEGQLALSLAQVIIAENRQAPGVDVGALTGGGGAASLEAFKPEIVAPRLGVPEGLSGLSAVEFVKKLARDFSDPKNRPSLAIGGGEAGAHSNGLFNLEGIYALNYLVGSVGAEGGIRFNPGGPLPEVPAVPTVGSLADWSQITSDLREGKTRLVMLRGANPVHGLPGSLGLREALDRDDLFIVSFSPFIDDTTILADLVLPDRVYLEDWGDDIPEPGPGYQVLGMQQPVVNPVSDLDPRSFPDVLLTLAQELGASRDLPWTNFQQVLREGANALFDLKRGSIQAGSRDEFWTKLLQQGGWWDQRSLGAAPSSRPNLAAIASRAAEPVPAGMADAPFHLVPFLHNSILDGRGAHLPWLQAAPDPMSTITWQMWVEMNDRKAKELGIKEGDVVSIQSSQGSIRALVYTTPATPPDVIGAPFGQGQIYGSHYALDRGENIMKVLEPTQVQGTGALAWANTRVKIVPTGDSIKISKMEGLATSFEFGVTEGERIIHTITPEHR